LKDFAKKTDHRPEILLSFGLRAEDRTGLINWLIQDPANAAVAAEQEFVRRWQAPNPRSGVS
jgi:hypothetical protein